jgi:hypothetical protein
MPVRRTVSEHDHFRVTIVLDRGSASDDEIGAAVPGLHARCTRLPVID